MHDNNYIILFCIDRYQHELQTYSCNNNSIIDTFLYLSIHTKQINENIKYLNKT